MSEEQTLELIKTLLTALDLIAWQCSYCENWFPNSVEAYNNDCCPDCLKGIEYIEHKY